MPDINDEKVYDANMPLVCRRDFLFSGRPFKAGANFPAKHMCCNRAKVQSLINANYLGQDWTVLKDDNGKPVDQTKPVAIQAGGGWWNVYLGSKKINKKALRKDSADKLVTSYTAEKSRRKLWP